MAFFSIQIDDTNSPKPTQLSAFARACQVPTPELSNELNHEEPLPVLSEAWCRGVRLKGGFSLTRISAAYVSIS